MKNLPDSIQELINRLNQSVNDYATITESKVFSKELTELFFEYEGNAFIALDGKTAYLLYREEELNWKSKAIGQPNVLIGIEDVAILPELERECSAINWVVVEGEVTAVATPFQLHFWDRINTIIDTAYANLE